MKNVFWEKVVWKFRQPMGNDVILLLSIGSIQIRAIVDPSTKAEVNQEIDLFVNMNKMHLFDIDTEEIIQ